MELVVVIAITVIFTGILIAYSGSGNRQIILNVEQAKIIGFLNRAKAFALEKRITAGQRVCAFGVHFEPRQLILFRDLPDNQLGNCEAGFNRSYDDGIEFLESFLLSNKLIIERYPGDIVFEPPYLVTHNPGLIRLNLVEGDGSVCIEVNAGGAIYSRTCP